MQVTLSVGTGNLTLAGTTGLSFTTGDGNADPTMTFTGTPSAVNTALSTLTYQPTPLANGTDTLVITTSDQGSLGSGGPKADTDSVAITVVAVNNAPVNTVPGPQTTGEDTGKVFSSGAGNAISIADVDATAAQVTLSVTSGQLTLSGTTGLTFTGGGQGTSSMTFNGTLAAINTALNGLTFQPANNSNGPVTLTIVTSDQGQTGLRRHAAGHRHGPDHRRGGQRRPGQHRAAGGASHAAEHGQELLPRRQQPDLGRRCRRQCGAGRPERDAAAP